MTRRGMVLHALISCVTCTVGCWWLHAKGRVLRVSARPVRRSLVWRRMRIRWRMSISMGLRQRLRMRVRVSRRVATRSPSYKRVWWRQSSAGP